MVFGVTNEMITPRLYVEEEAFDRSGLAHSRTHTTTTESSETSTVLLQSVNPTTPGTLSKSEHQHLFDLGILASHEVHTSLNKLRHSLLYPRDSQHLSRTPSLRWQGVGFSRKEQILALLSLKVYID